MIKGYARSFAAGLSAPIPYQMQRQQESRGQQHFAAIDEPESPSIVVVAIVWCTVLLMSISVANLLSSLAYLRGQITRGHHCEKHHVPPPISCRPRRDLHTRRLQILKDQHNQHNNAVGQMIYSSSNIRRFRSLKAHSTCLRNS